MILPEPPDSKLHRMSFLTIDRPEATVQPPLKCRPGGEATLNRFISTFPFSKKLQNQNPIYIHCTSLVAQLVKKPPAIQQTWVQSLGWDVPLEKGKASHSSILAWRIPWTVQSMGVQRVGHNQSHFHFHIYSLFQLLLLFWGWGGGDSFSNLDVCQNHLKTLSSKISPLLYLSKPMNIRGPVFYPVSQAIPMYMILRLHLKMHYSEYRTCVIEC